MVSVCFYFQIHQPKRVKRYSFFDIGKDMDYFNSEEDRLSNKKILDKVSEKCYVPATKLWLRLLNEYPELKFSVSISGVLIEQLEEHRNDVLTLFQELRDTGRVEFLAETYYHSLSFIYSKDEFIEQVREHMRTIKKHFNTSPKVLRNTELIYNNSFAKIAELMGFKAVLGEGVDYLLYQQNPNFVYKARGSNIRVLLRNYRLSDDISFRFSNREWEHYPLTAEKFASWVSQINGNGTNVNLFMDYETFGEHQWRETGIFEFLSHLPKEILKHPDNDFATPSELAEKPPHAEIDVEKVTSWADTERDLSAWIGNDMQKEALRTIYSFNPPKEHLKTWRLLQTSDHFYYMCTKWFADGDVHKYFNPYDSPYEAFISYMNVLKDFKLRFKNTRKKHLLKRSLTPFFTIDGRELNTLIDLLVYLTIAPQEAFERHFKNKDFQNWIRNSLGFKRLAREFDKRKKRETLIRFLEKEIKDYIKRLE